MRIRISKVPSNPPACQWKVAAAGSACVFPTLAEAHTFARVLLKLAGVLK